MSDMAARPRGGWQFGTRLSRRSMLQEGLDDPAPDVYTVTRLPSGGFEVHHYPTKDAARPCCVITVTPLDDETNVDALARAARRCDEKHG